jgi:uncharacterized protein YyaL (SSP411 family)
MLYDQALLAVLYPEAYRQTAQQVLAFALRDMRAASWDSPTGGCQPRG